MVHSSQKTTEFRANLEFAMKPVQLLGWKSLQEKPFDYFKCPHCGKVQQSFTAWRNASPAEESFRGRIGIRKRCKGPLPFAQDAAKRSHWTAISPVLALASVRYAGMCSQSRTTTV